MMRFGIFFILVTMFSCRSGEVIAQRQGIRGEVLWFGGNVMPAPGRPPVAKLGIRREILIYELTHFNDASQDGTFFTDVKTRLVATATSDDDGSFKVKLPPGRYSVFVKEQQGLFANLFTGEGEINPVTVEPRKFTHVTVTVDYEAIY